MVEHYTDIMNTYAISKPVMSEYEDLYGRKAAERCMESAEQIFIQRRRPAEQCGIYLGHLFSSNEIFLGTSRGNVIKTQSAVWMVEASTWNSAAIGSTAGTLDDGELTAEDIEGTENPQDYSPVDIDADKRTAAKK